MYRRYPPASPLSPRAFAVTLGLILLLAVAVASCSGAATADVGRVEAAKPAPSLYQGKTAYWWSKRAQQARRDANARRQTIRRLRRTLTYSPTIREAVQLATIAYPAFSSARAWQIIRHESWMTSDPAHARNPASTASGLYQFLTSTWASTPYGRLSIWSPYAQSLAAGWMHSTGRGCEWQIGASC